MNSELILKIARHTLEIESQAIMDFSRQLGEDFIHAVQKIFHCRGKILFSGIGKSGIIAQKIASTFNSIGIISIFLHPVEALHGDLGIINQDDLLIVLSKSSETEELFTLISFIKKKGIPLITILGKRKSSLGDLADINIIYDVKEEACPLRVTPTTSTTLSLAIGDAMAACLIALKKIKIEDFALNHPGGSIGKAYYIKIKDIMHKEDENPQLPPNASIESIIEVITKKRMGAVNIVDQQNLLLGIITDGDIRRALKNRYSFFNLKAEDVMTPNPITIHEEELAVNAIDLLENRPSQIPVLPVIDAFGRNVGIIRIHDLVKAGL